MDLSNLSAAELKKLAHDVEHELVSRSKSEREAARNEILSIAQSVGISLSELLESAGRKKSGDAPGRKVAVQYRNPNNAGQEWSGCGRQPAWVKEWATQHQSIDGLKERSDVRDCFSDTATRDMIARTWTVSHLARNSATYSRYLLSAF